MRSRCIIMNEPDESWFDDLHCLDHNIKDGQSLWCMEIWDLLDGFFNQQEGSGEYQPWSLKCIMLYACSRTFISTLVVSQYMDDLLIIMVVGVFPSFSSLYEIRILCMHSLVCSSLHVCTYANMSRLIKGNRNHVYSDIIPVIIMTSFRC